MASFYWNAHLNELIFGLSKNFLNNGFKFSVVVIGKLLVMRAHQTK